MVTGAVVSAAGAWVTLRARAEGSIPVSERPRVPSQEAREALFAELQPVKLTKCQFARYGEQHDGGYLACRNLLTEVRAAYSYGISGYDGWGCDISTELKVPVH